MSPHRVENSSAAMEPPVVTLLALQKCEYHTGNDGHVGVHVGGG